MLAASVAIFVWLSYAGAPPKQRPARERGRAVRIFEVQAIEVVPRIVGYGVVEAQRSWQAVAEVGGTIIEMGPGVEVGRRVPEGALLYRIDPGSFTLEKSRTEATVRGVQAQIDELKAREKAARSSLDLERKVLDLARKDLERARKALEAGVGSATAVEAAEREVINAEKAVLSHENTLLELPATRRVLAAQIAQQQTGVEGARMDLAKTEVFAPFTMRLREVNASLHQAVSPGQVILVGDGIDVMEVAAQMPVGAIGPLLRPRSTPTPTPAPTAPDAAPEATATPEATAAPEAPPPRAEAEGGAPPAPPPAPRTAAIQAVVRLKSQGVESTWEGRFRRFQGVDPATRTSGVVVEITEPRRNGGGPPLLPGLHVEVELRGAPRSSCLAIPRSAIFHDKVYVAGEGDRLEVRPVETDLLQEAYACVTSGLRPGDRVVLTELSPAVEGMLLTPRPDATIAAWLAAAGRGEAEGTTPPAEAPPPGDPPKTPDPGKADGPPRRKGAP